MTLNHFLSQKLDELQKKNPRFSMRALAQKAGISPGRLNEIFHERRPLSDHYSNRIAYGLSLSQEEQVALSGFVTVRAKRMNFQKVLENQELRLITSWEPYALLNLMKTDDFESSTEWIAKRLALPIEKIEECLKLLEAQGIIKMKHGRWLRIPEQMTTTADIPSSAIVEGHLANLKKATDALFKVSADKRNYATMTMPINVSKIEEAKQLMTQFRRKLCLLLEEGPKTEVYNISMQLYPLTDIDSREISD
jgi:DNA-binding Lrp family transcriptional regulator